MKNRWFEFRPSLRIFVLAIILSSTFFTAAQQPRLVVPEGHLCIDKDYNNNPIHSAISPDGKFIATTRNSKLRIWELQSGNLIQTFQPFPNGISAVCFSGDNRQVLVAGYDIEKPSKCAVQIYNMYTNENSELVSNPVITYINDIILSKDKTRAIITGDTLVMVYNFKTHIVEREIPVQYASATFSIPGKDRFITMGSITKIWNLQEEEFTVKNVIPTHRHANQMVSESNYLVQSESDLKIRSLKDNRVEQKFYFGERLLKAAIGGNGQFILIKTYTDSLYVVDVKKNKIIFSDEGILDMQIQPDGNAFIYKKDGIPPQMRRFSNIYKNINIFSHEDQRYFKSYSGFERGSQYMLVGRGNVMFNLSIDILNIHTLQKTSTLEGHAVTVEYASMNKSGTKLYTSSSSSYDNVFDLRTGKLIGRHIPTNEEILEMAPFDSVINSKWVNYYFDYYGQPGSISCVMLMDTRDSIICTFYPIDSSDYLTLLPTGHYQCSPAAAKLLHYVTADLKVITFEQLDVKYNRPDLVLKAIGNTDTNLINSYKKAYDKRIKKLGIDTTQFADGYSVPEAEFENRDAVEYEQNNGNLLLKIHGADSTYKLDRFNIWVNEIPLYGQRGISLRNKKVNTFDTTITITLSAGENRIETSILNVNGTESYRIPLFVKYTPKTPETPKVYFVGFGMDRFANAQYNLVYSSKDIRDLVKAMRKRYGDTLVVDTFFNANFTAANLHAVKKKLLYSKVNDKVIVAYSGHGLLSKDYDYYLSTYNVDFEHPENRGLPYEALESVLDSIPARQKLLLIDACHSGEVDKDEAHLFASVADSLGLKRGTNIRLSNTSKSHLGLKNSFELMQELFVNVSKGTGATIISASSGTQFALERNDLQNGVFTYSILEAMQQHNSINVSELKLIVSNRVQELTAGMQKPTSRSETIYNDWKVW